MKRSAASVISAGSAFIALIGLGAFVVNTPAANAVTVGYVCSAPGYGSQAISLSGSFSTSPPSVLVNSPATLNATVSGSSLSAPEAVNFWTVVANVTLDGPSGQRTLQATGSGGFIPAGSPFTGVASVTWTPRTSGTYLVKARNVSFTAKLATQGTITAQCTPQSPISTNFTAT
jgi:hypothetical protein